MTLNTSECADINKIYVKSKKRTCKAELSIFSGSASGSGNPSGISTCDVLHNLETFVQFKNHEKQQWKSVTFSKAAG